MDSLTSWQHHIREEMTEDPLFQLEVIAETVTPIITNFGKALTESFALLGDGITAAFQAIGEAYQNAEDKYRMAHAKDVTPFEPAGLLDGPCVDVTAEASSSGTATMSRATGPDWLKGDSDA